MTRKTSYRIKYALYLASYKKRTKKLLFLNTRAVDKSATARKSFLLLFFKKEVLSY